MIFQGLSLVPIHRDTQIDLKTEKGGVVKGHNKKEENWKPRKKSPEAKENNFQGLLPVPIHRDTRKDLKTEEGSVIKGQNKQKQESRTEG